MNQTTRFGVSIETDLLDKFDRFIADRGYNNRSESLRDLIREQLISERLISPVGEVFGALVFIYDHHHTGLSRNLADLQHENYQIIISSSHVHVDHDTCLEVILMRGLAQEVRAIADRILSYKGVQHGKLTLTTALEDKSVKE